MYKSCRYEKPVLHKYFLAALISLCCLTATACTKNEPFDELPDDIEDEPTLSEPVFEESELVWRVEPTLDYDKIVFCGWCNTFTVGDHYGFRIDIETGLTIEEPWVFGHGGDEKYFLYDEAKGLYGHYSCQPGDYELKLWPADEFLLNMDWYSDRIIAFQKINSDRIRKVDSGDEWTEYDFSEAYISEKFAIAHGIVLVSDFIYDNDGSYNSDFYCYVKNSIAMILNDKWGVLDTEGNVIVPFDFEDILLIDEETAFAKTNGKYGILEIKATSQDTAPPPTSGNEPATESAETPMLYITTDNVNLREGAGTEFARILTVPTGKAVNVIDFLDYEWFLVEYEGQTGYMKSEYLIEAVDEVDVLTESKEQLQLPYLGREEVTPLFAGRSTIADWIKDIKMDNVYYSFYIESATGYARFEVYTDFFRLSSFYIEDNSIAYFRYNNEQGIYKSLTDEILALKVIEVLDLDFEYMGVPFIIRGITKGTDADTVRLAFRDMKREIVIKNKYDDYTHSYTFLSSQQLYNLQDIVPHAVVEDEDINIPWFHYIGGIDCENDAPQKNHNCTRSISYVHTSSEEGLYTKYALRSEITFYINENGKVAAFGYRDLTHRD